MKMSKIIALYSSLILGTIAFANPYSANAMGDGRPGRCNIDVCVVRTDTGDTIIATTNYYVWTPSGWVLQHSVESITPKNPRLQ
jgi:hypothetical protein